MRTIVLNRPLVLAFALAGVCVGAAALAWISDMPTAGAALLAGSSPGVVVTLFEALRGLDDRADEATRRSCRLAMALLMVPLFTLIALAARLWVSLPHDG